MSTLFKPMLATDADLTTLKFPILASAKLDGVRAIVRNGIVYSRSNKPIPNRFVQLELSSFEGFDGELIVGEPFSKTVYRDTVSHVMSHDKTNFDLRFYAFDHVKDLSLPYTERVKQLEGYSNVHPQHIISNLVELLALEEKMLDIGYEGLILRDAQAPYKTGRSTVKEGYLLKLKRFTDAEFTVVGFEERMKNDNEKTTNELGRSRRSSHKENKHGRGDLGALIVQGHGFSFNVGTGLSDNDRATIWADRAGYLGKLAKVKYFAIGMKDAPRFPVFLGWREGD